jgi:AAHS family 4-hydroxybenzoate transporter-like MFS transporter
MPNAAALSSEYVPARWRPFAVTLTIVCIPLGGAIAGEAAALIIPRYGWRVLFIAGGVAPFVAAVALWMVLPESPSFLARGPHRTRTWSARTLASLFEGGLARDTAALWVSFFFGLMVIYVLILLLPALLTSAAAGFPQSLASRALAMSNYGGVVGAVLGAVAMQRFGSRVTMLSMAAAAAACAAMLAGWPLDPRRAGGLLAMILVTGGLINGVQTTMYALAAHVYPTDIRSTGVGMAVAIGRIGNVAAAYAGSAAIDRGGPAGYFGLWSALMLLVFAGLAAVRRHVPR